MSLSISDIKPFIGSKDFEESRDFYIAMGWKAKLDTENFTELELGSHRFYLQKYYQQEWCDNSMLYINVENANSWYEHTRRVLSLRSYGQAKVSKPSEQSYGALVTFVGDPAGVLLHFAQLRTGDQ